MGLAVATAQQSAAMIPRIGLVVANAQSISARELQRGLRELGYVERQNILTEARYFDDKLDQIPSLVKDWYKSGWMSLSFPISERFERPSN